MAKFPNSHNLLLSSARIIPPRNFVTNTIRNRRNDSLRNVTIAGLGNVRLNWEITWRAVTSNFATSRPGQSPCNLSGVRNDERMNEISFSKALGGPGDFNRNISNRNLCRGAALSSSGEFNAEKLRELN